MSKANEMSIEDFRALPVRSAATDHTSKVGSLIIVPHPEGELHDSGYRGMDFVACDQASNPMWRVGAFSDVIHIDGIGGLGKDWLRRHGTVPQFVLPSGWSMDCLAKSGLLRIFPSPHMCDGIDIETELPYSSFEIFPIPNPKYHEAVAQ